MARGRTSDELNLLHDHRRLRVGSVIDGHFCDGWAIPGVTSLGAWLVVFDDRSGIYSRHTCDLVFCPAETDARSNAPRGPGHTRVLAEGDPILRTDAEWRVRRDPSITCDRRSVRLTGLGCDDGDGESGVAVPEADGWWRVSLDRRIGLLFLHQSNLEFTNG